MLIQTITEIQKRIIKIIMIQFLQNIYILLLQLITIYIGKIMKIHIFIRL